MDLPTAPHADICFEESHDGEKFPTVCQHLNISNSSDLVSSGSQIIRTQPKLPMLSF